MPSVLFVCTGNICRSPAAHAVLAAHVARAGLAVTVDSAGTDGWHAGQLPDERARAEGARRGYTLDHRSRKVRPVDLHTFDLVLAMDRGHLHALQTLATPPRHGQLFLFRAFDPDPGDMDVADPYWRGAPAFAVMFDVIERVTPRIVAHVAALPGARLDLSARARAAGRLPPREVLEAGARLAGRLHREGPGAVPALQGPATAVPEGIREPRLTTAALVYGLGCMLYEAFAGERLLEGPDLGERAARQDDAVRHDALIAARLADERVPAEARALLARMLGHDDASRPDLVAVEQACADLARAARREA